jgi:hypothetical protein
MLKIQNLHANVGNKPILKGIMLDVPALYDDADVCVAEGLAAMERGDEAPQDEVFARWRTKYG